MSAGYWIVVGTVAVAGLASWLATMAETPEWRLPHRRAPFVVTFQLVSARFPDSPPADGQIAAMGLGLIPPSSHHFPTAREEAFDDTAFIEQVNAIIAVRPDSVIIVGAQDLLMSGESMDRVVELIRQVVRPLSEIGSHSYVLGATSYYADLVVQSSMDGRSIYKLTRGWNQELTRRLTPLGAVVAPTLAELFRAMKTHDRRPVGVEMVSQGADDETSVS